MSPINNDNKTNSNGGEKEEEILDVLIIGAGWAGLATAKELQAKSNSTTNIRILEGRETFGGRCRTHVFEDGTAADLGAQWIHGARKQNPIYKTALESGLEIHRSQYESQVVYQDHDDGTTTEVSKETYEKMEEELLEKDGFWAYQERRQDDDDHDCTMRQCANDYLAKINATDEQRVWLNYLLDSNITQEYSGDMQDMSMYWWDSDEDIPGGDAQFGDRIGYRDLLKYFARDMEHLLQYNSKVTCIGWKDDNRVVVHYRQHGEPKQLVARKVVITVPLGVLKKNVINFEPVLPKHKQRAIDGLGMGLLNKCVMWWDEEDAANLPWPLDKEWIERIVAPNAGTEEDPQGRWTEFFSTTPVTGGKPMLCGFTAGRVAEEMEKLTEAEIEKSCLTALSNMFDGAEIPTPRRVVVTKWGQDEWTYGGYSFNKVHGKHTHHKELAEPLSQRLYFAGEHCHPQYFGTTQGAFLSGVSAAKQIAKHDNSLLQKAKAAVKTALKGSPQPVKQAVAVAV